MRILILVLSYTEPPYDELMRAQMETFDSIGVDGATTIYYYGGIPKDEEVGYVVTNFPDRPHSATIQFKCRDDYYYMAAKLKECLRVVWSSPYDLIFRTNSSSYLNPKEVLKFAEGLPIEKCYAGWTFDDTNDDGGLCVSGAGIWLSRDCAKILMDEIDPEKEIEEDVYIGRILRKHGIVAIDDKSREDVNFIHSGIPKNKYHYRFKGHHDRLIDAHNMRKIHKLITS